MKGSGGQRRHAPRLGVSDRMLLGGLVLSALVVLGMMLLASRLFETGIRKEAFEGSKLTAATVSEQIFEREEFRSGRLTAEALADFQRLIPRLPNLAGARVWEEPGEVVVSAGSVPAVSHSSGHSGLLGALAGRNEVEADTEGTFEVFVPIAPGERIDPRYAMELALPSAPVEEHIGEERTQLTILLGVAAILLYVSLLPGISRASRALADLRPRDRRLERSSPGASPGGRSCPTTSPRSTWRPARSRDSSPWLAGSTRDAACSARASSCRLWRGGGRCET